MSCLLRAFKPPSLAMACDSSAQRVCITQFAELLTGPSPPCCARSALAGSRGCRSQAARRAAHRAPQAARARTCVALVQMATLPLRQGVLHLPVRLHANFNVGKLGVHDDSLCRQVKQHQPPTSSPTAQCISGSSQSCDGHSTMT